MSQGPYLRKYGVETTIPYHTFEVDGIDLRKDSAPGTADTFIMKDEGVEAAATNASTDEGRGYSLVLTATEMQAARIVVYLEDQTATKVWLDTVLVIETYGHANAMHAFDLDTASTAQTGDNFARLGAPAGSDVSADIAAVKVDTAAVKVKTDFLPSATAGTSGGLVIDGTNSGAISFTAGATISNASGTALTVTSSGGDGDGIAITANGSGHGVDVLGGTASGSAFNLVGGTHGHGIRAAGNGIGHGIETRAIGSGSGLAATGAGSSPGLSLFGGPNGHGLGASGNGVGHGIFANVTGSGNEIDGNIVGTITTTTNLTNAATSGDLTAIMKTSVAAAVWDEDIVAAHNTADTAGAILNNILPEKNAAFNNIEFLMVDSTDHVTPKTGRTVSITRSIDGAAFGAGTGSAAEVANGIYQYDASAADMNGTIITFRFTATDADDVFLTLKTSG